MLNQQQQGYTHGFSVVFESREDRDHYTNNDPVHRAYAQKLRTVAEKVVVVDYEPHVF